MMKSIAGWIGSALFATLAAAAGPRALRRRRNPHRKRARKRCSATSTRSLPTSPTRCCSATWGGPPLAAGSQPVTVAALIAMNRPDQLRSHLQRARDNGLTEQELVEAITGVLCRLAQRHHCRRWRGKCSRRSELQPTKERGGHRSPAAAPGARRLQA